MSRGLHARANSNLSDIRIVILLGAPFTHQNFERIGVNELSRDFEVFVLDCNEWINSIKIDHELGIEKWHNHLVVKDIHEFRNLMSIINPSYAIDFIGLQTMDRNLEIIENLRELKVNLIFQNSGPVPNLYSGLRGIFVRIIEKAMRKTYDSSIYRINEGKSEIQKKFKFRKFRSQLSRIITPIKIRRKIPYAVIITGTKTKNLMAILARSKIYAASNDYHTFRRVITSQKNSARILGPQYFLFIDDCITSALDWRTLNIEPPVSDLNYFSDLNKFFDFLENEFNVKVVIAGHPNTKNNFKYDAKFKGRSVIYDNTAALAVHAEAVFCHASTAVSFAILANRPVYIITTSEIQSSFFRSSIEGVSKALGRRPILIDVVNDRKLFENLSTTKHYSSYISKYIKTYYTEELQPWASFREYVEKRTLSN